jgi:very-short-patch-repair endonuclease
VIGRYIVDFLAPSARLIVEVDGGYHQCRRTADERRDRWMQRQGYTVLRVSAGDVMSNAALVVDGIAGIVGGSGETG